MGVLPLREKKYLCYIIIKHCPKNGKLTPTRNLMRGRTLKYPLKPLLLLHFVVHWCSVFLSFLSFNLLLRFCLPCVRTDTLFAKLRLEGRLERFGNVCGCMRWLVLSFQINSSYCQNVVCLCLE